MNHRDDGRPVATLAQALDRLMTQQDLKRLAGIVRPKRLPTSKADLSALVIAHLDGDGLERVYQSLTEREKAAVSEVVHSIDSRLDTTVFNAKYGPPPDRRITRYEEKSPLEFLLYGNGVMPEDLKRRLKAFVPAPLRSTVRTLAETPTTYQRPFSRWNDTTERFEERTEPIPTRIHDAEHVAPREFAALLRLVDADRVTVSETTQRASAASLQAITEVLDGGDYYPPLPPAKHKWDDENAGPIRAFAWPLLLQAGGLAKRSGTKLALTPAGRKALASPPAETLRMLWNKWLDASLLDEFSRVEAVKGQSGKAGRSLVAPANRRAGIAEGLAQCPVGDWVTPAELLRSMRAAGIAYAVSKTPWALYVCDAHYGGIGDPDLLDGRYLLAFLLEYAATLGVVDVALVPPARARNDHRRQWGTDELAFFSRYDGLVALRLTPLGAFVLGLKEQYVAARPETKALLRFGRGAVVEAIGDLDTSDQLALEAFAVPSGPGRWRLEPGKLLDAVAAGRPVEEMQQFLVTRCGGEDLPDEITRLLAAAEDRSSAVRDAGAARLFVCQDATLAAIVTHDDRTRPHVFGAVGRTLIVPAASDAAFRRGLRALGYLVATGGVVRADAGDGSRKPRRTKA